jgi:hypothetical protein
MTNQCWIEFPDTKEVFTIDAMWSINEGRSATVTQNPVENGFKMADGREKSPNTLSLSGSISLINPERDAVLDPEGTGYHTDFKRRMIAAHESDEICIVDLGIYGRFENMVFDSLPFFADADRGLGTHFDFTFTQITVVTTKIKDLNALKVQGDVGAGATAGARTVDSQATKSRWNMPANKGLVGYTGANKTLADRSDLLATTPGGSR